MKTEYGKPGIVSIKSLNCSPFPQNFTFGAEHSPGSCFIYLKVLTSITHWLRVKEILQNNKTVLKLYAVKKECKTKTHKGSKVSKEGNK